MSRRASRSPTLSTLIVFVLTTTSCRDKNLLDNRNKSETSPSGKNGEYVVDGTLNDKSPKRPIDGEDPATGYDIWKNIDGLMYTGRATSSGKYRLEVYPSAGGKILQTLGHHGAIEWAVEERNLTCLPGTRNAIPLVCELSIDASKVFETLPPGTIVNAKVSAASGKEGSLNRSTKTISLWAVTRFLAAETAVRERVINIFASPEDLRSIKGAKIDGVNCELRPPSMGVLRRCFLQGSLQTGEREFTIETSDGTTTFPVLVLAPGAIHTPTGVNLSAPPWQDTGGTASFETQVRSMVLAADPNRRIFWLSGTDTAKELWTFWDVDRGWRRQRYEGLLPNGPVIRGASNGNIAFFGGSISDKVHSLTLCKPSNFGPRSATIDQNTPDYRCQNSSKLSSSLPTLPAEQTWRVSLMQHKGSEYFFAWAYPEVISDAICYQVDVETGVSSKLPCVIRPGAIQAEVGGRTIFVLSDSRGEISPFAQWNADTQKMEAVNVKGYTPTKRSAAIGEMSHVCSSGNNLIFQWITSDSSITGLVANFIDGAIELFDIPSSYPQLPVECSGIDGGGLFAVIPSWSAYAGQGTLFFDGQASKWTSQNGLFHPYVPQAGKGATWNEFRTIRSLAGGVVTIMYASEAGTLGTRIVAPFLK